MLLCGAATVGARSDIAQVLQNAALLDEMRLLTLMTQLYQLLLETLELLHLDPDKLNVVVEQVVHPLASTCRVRLELQEHPDVRDAHL